LIAQLRYLSKQRFTNKTTSKYNFEKTTITALSKEVRF
jgi:hypothetical protein